MNPVKGETPLKLADGRQFTLVLDMEALISAEASYGKPLQQLLADMGAGYMGAVGSLLQASLSRRHADLGMSRGEALELFLANQEAVGEVLGAAAKAAFPDASAGGKAPASPPAGKHSGGSGAKPD